MGSVAVAAASVVRARLSPPSRPAPAPLTARALQVIAVGLSVDYSAHIGHCFMTKRVGTNDQRIAATLSDVGAAVMNGGLSTFLAVCLLGTSQSYVFRVLFQCFFLTVTLGLAHGMLFLPVVLSLLGPAAYAFDVVGGANDGDSLCGFDGGKALAAEAKAEKVLPMTAVVKGV